MEELQGKLSFVGTQDGLVDEVVGLGVADDDGECFSFRLRLLLLVEDILLC